MKKTINKTVRALTPVFTESRARSLDAFSAQAAFFTFISLVPLCALAFGIIKALPVDLSGLYSKIVPLIPPLLDTFISEAYSTVGESSSTAVISVSAVIMFFTASRGIYSILRGVRSAYGEDARGGIRLRAGSLLYTLLFVLLILGSFLLLVFGNFIVRAVRETAPEWVDISFFGAFVRTGATFVIIFVSHLAGYRFIPQNRLSFLRSLPGTFFASFVWILISFFYSVYIDWFTKSGVSIYGSLGATVLLLLWLYSCMSATLTGGLINSLIAEKKREPAPEGPDAEE